MKKTLGYLGLFFGVTGALACLAGLGGVWLLHAKIQRPLGEVADALAGLGAEIEARAGEVAAGVETTRATVNELDERVAGRTQELLDLSDQDLARLAEGYARVRLAVQGLRDLAELARVAMDFVEQTVGMVESTVGFVRSDRQARVGLRTAVEEGRREIDEAARLLDDVTLRLTELRSGRALPDAGGPLRSISNRVDASLGELQGKVEVFGAAIGEMRQGVVEVHARIRTFLVRMALALSLLLLWQLAAQASLAAQGWGWARARRVTRASSP